MMTKKNNGKYKDKELVQFKGFINKVIFDNGDGSKIAKFQDVNGKEFVCVGKVPGADKYNLINISGDFIEHAKYGNQFKVTYSFTETPATLEGLTNYLSDYIEGIGKVRSKKIIDYFGNSIFNVLEKEQHRLSECPVISKNLAQKIISSWNKENNQLLRQVSLFLAKYNINSGWADKIIATYGSKSLEIIKINPYSLTKVNGIGFKKAEEMAFSMGRDKYDSDRIKASFAYCLQIASTEGHTLLFKSEIIEHANKLLSLDIDPEVIEEQFQQAVKSKDIVIENIKINNNSQIACYLPNIYKIEKEFVDNIKRIRENNLELDKNKVTKLLNEESKTHSLQLSTQQEIGVNNIFEHSISILTGSPGSGKSTSLSLAISLAEKLGLKCLCCSPTGRAAKRIQQITKHEAFTIHVALQYIPEINKFKKNLDDPLDYDLILVDESSMMDLELANSLLSAVGNKTHIVFIGDYNQLPSIGPGVVLKDLIRCEKIPVTNLTRIYRQGQQSLIIDNAYRIINGEFPIFGDKDTDCMFIKANQLINGHYCNQLEWVKHKLPEIINRLSTSFKLDKFKDIQIITPTRQGPAGCEAFNELLHDHFNPNNITVNILGNKFKVGDRVMQMKNIYNDDYTLYNGDIGFIKEINSEERTITIQFDEQTINYPYSEINNLCLSYISSCHKMQGSEFDYIILVLLTQHYALLERNLLCTAFTRAKKKLIVVGSEKAISIAINNISSKSRNSLLSFRLKFIK